MDNTQRIRVGISVGDINGIGIEIVLKTFQDKRILEFCTPILFASNEILSVHKKTLNINTPVNRISSVEKSVSGKVNLVNAWAEKPPVEIGQANETGGEYAFKSLNMAVAALKDGFIDVLVTAPINKKTIQSEQFHFPGHTEFLDAQLEGEALMILLSGDLRVALLTGHIPIETVTKSITIELIHNKVKTLHKTLQQDFSISKPKIAILSINPHAGDDGVIGNEDNQIVVPAIENLNKEGIYVYGPYPADSFFGSGNYQKFDAILAAYHDQGLTPFKTLSFGSGVNYTAGLNRIRTSPDHGTAFDIAGKGIADASSFKEAVFTAISIFKTRQQNTALTEGALK